MNRVKEVPLSDAYWFQEGPGLRNWQFTTSGIKVLNVGNILPNGTIDLTRTDRHVSVEEFDRKYSHFAVDAGDLVIASSGISFDEDGFLRTKVAFVHEQHLPLCMNTSTIRFKAKTDVSDLAFLRHWFQSASFRTQISRLVTGSAQLNFGPSHLKQMTIPLPPLDEQKRIAAILDQADALRRLRARALDRLNDIGQAIFHEMFGDPAVDEERWPSRPLSEFVREQDDIKCGPFGTQLLKSEFCDDGVPLWGIKQVNKHFQIPTHEFVTEEKARVLSQYSILPKDIIMTRKGTIGNCAVYPESFAIGLMHSDLLRLRVDPEQHNAVFVAAQLRFNRSFLLQLELISGGAIMAGINVGRLKALHAIAPPKALQDEYAARIANADRALASLRLSAKTSETLFTSLQHRAFQGEL